MKRKKRVFSLIMVFALILAMFPAGNISVMAADCMVSYVNLDGTSISSATVTSGNAIGTLPTEADLFAWVDQRGNIVTTGTIVTDSMKITAIHNADITSQGTLDGGNVSWYLCNDKLFVLGTGTISILDRTLSGTSKKYGFSMGTIPIDYPDVLYDWITPSSVGDNLAGGFGDYTAPASPVFDYNLSIDRPYTMSGQTIGLPATALNDAIPWIANASDIKEMLFAETVSLSGNFTLYFNANSTIVAPGSVNESIYTNLETIYLYSDTSAIKRMGGMFARCPELKNIYTGTNDSFDMTSCVETAGMFYGDEKLLCQDTSANASIINKITNFGSVVDMRYMFFDCKSLKRPALSSLDISSVTDISYAFAGCQNAGLQIGSSANSYDIGGWDFSNVVSAMFAFSGPSIDITSADPVSNLWGPSTATTVVGDVDLSRWDFSSLVVADYMFAQNSGITGVVWANSSAPLLEDASCMFAWNSGLVSVDFSNTSLNNLKYAVAMFFGSGASSSSAIFEGANLSSLEDASFMFYNTTFRLINLDNTNPSKLVNGTGMFYNSSNLTSLGSEGLSDWRLPVLTTADYMFGNLPNLLLLDLSDSGMDAVTSMAYFAFNDSSLTEFDTSTWNIGSTCQDISGFLMGAGRIPSLNLSSWDTSGIENAFYAFEGMSNLETINLGGTTWPKLKVSYGMFANDYSLKTLSFDDGVVAGALEDARGMFYGDISLNALNIKDFISNKTTEISYFLDSAGSLKSLDVSGWNTTSVKYFQRAFADMTALEDFTIGNYFSTAKALSTAEMYKEDVSLKDASAQAVIAKLDTTSLKDAYEMFYKVSKLTDADLSGKNFSGVENLSLMFAYDNALSVITLPVSFASGVENMATNGKNIFYVDEDTLTYLTVAGNSMPAAIGAYNWEGDNRYFLFHESSKINGFEKTEYQFPLSANSSDTANLEYNVVSTFYLNSKPADISYSWKYGKTALANALNTYSVTQSNLGTYTVTAALADAVYGGTTSESFTISDSASVKNIVANYHGGNIIIGKPYAKSDVEVVVNYSDGTSKTLSVGDFTVDSTDVKVKGTNTFTAYYTDAAGNDFSANFNVTGIRAVGSITVEYTGPQVKKGSEYNTTYITAKAYYADDTSKSEGFTIKPTSYSSKKVEKVGVNTFTAYYKDNVTGATLQDTFTVNGYAVQNVSSITAEYAGPNIPVGSNYDPGNVTVTIQYNDGTPDATTKDFTVDSLLVAAKGANSFTATYTDDFGTNYSASFAVTGTDGGTSATSSKNSNSGNASSSAGAKTGDSINLWGFVLMFVALGTLLAGIVYYRRKIVTK